MRLRGGPRYQTLLEASAIKPSVRPTSLQQGLYAFRAAGQLVNVDGCA